jgi:dUTP pyrophosphatase
MILTPVYKMDLEEVDSLPTSIRGKGGFGSTGK